MNPESNKVLIKAENVSFGFPGSNGSILENVTLEVKIGELLGIVGESGSGKTTLLKLLAGLEKPIRGNIEKFCPTRGGFVFQNPVLLDWLNVEQNIFFPLHSYENNDERLESLLIDIDLSPARKKYPRELSGGMRSRVQLARSLYHEPQILFLDEAFSTLDEKLRYQSNMLLKDLRSRYNFSALIVSHSIQEAVFLSDRLIVIKKGRGHNPARIEKIENGFNFSKGSIEVLDYPEFHKQVALVRNILLTDG